MSASSQRGKQKHFRSTTEWQHIIDDYTRSGLTQQAYCEQASIPKSSFYKWYRRLKQQNNDPQTQSMSFIQLPETTSRLPESPWHIELDLGHGVTLRLTR